MKKLSPYLIIFLSFLAFILVGFLLLLLPLSSKVNPLSVPEALFLSFSSVTVTGASPFILSETLSTFGFIVVYVLMQIGGLSIITVTMFIFILLGAKIGIADRLLIKESMNQHNYGGLVKLIKKIMTLSAMIQGVGIVFHTLLLLQGYRFTDALFLSIFHVGSAYNNVGFEIFSIKEFAGINGITQLIYPLTALLVILGGLGFIVVQEIIEKKRYNKLSIHSKIIIKTSIFFWIFGWISFFLSSSGDSHFTVVESLFYAATMRSAGYLFEPIASLSGLAIFTIIFLSYIGGAPASTAGGVKLTTAYVMYANLKSHVLQKPVIVSKRVIANETKIRVLNLLTASLFIIMFFTWLLLMIDSVQFGTAFFEVISLFSNVGLSIRTHEILNNGAKYILSFVMLIGRMGPLSFLLIINAKWYKPQSHIEYIEEKIMVG